MTTFASIDLGSNTIRLMVVQKKENGFETLFQSQKITRLGQGLGQTGNLSPEAITRTTEAICTMQAEASRFTLQNFWIVATSAVRSARNSELLITQVKKKTGLHIEVISWEEEARRMLLGVSYGMGINSGRKIVFDIGGGSTEYLYAHEETIVSSFGTDLGVVRLSETYLTQDPLIPQELNNLIREIELKIQITQNKLGTLHKDTTIIGTAGTVTTIAALDLNLFPYNPDKINGHVMTIDTITNLLQDLQKMTLAERAAIPQIENGRADLIVPGLYIVERTMRMFGLNEIYVSDSGLREGIFLDRLNRA